MARRTKEKSDLGKAAPCENWSGSLDSNQRPPAPEADIVRCAHCALTYQNDVIQWFPELGLRVVQYKQRLAGYYWQ